METPLPHMIILRALPSSEKDTKVKERFVVCISEYKQQKRSWSLTIMNDSKIFMKDYKLVTDSSSATPAETYLIERESSRHPVVYYQSQMNRTGRYMEIPRVQKIYEYDMTPRLKILPTKFYKVYMNKDVEMRWHFTVADAEAEAEPKIPVHVQEAYIEHALINKDVCPISLEVLERGKVFCTPCGHLFATGLVENLEVCPVCRKTI